MLDAEIVADHPVHPGATVIKVIICQNDEDRVFPLLSLDEDSVAPKELEGLHGIIRKGDDGIIVIDSIGNTWNLVS